MSDLATDGWEHFPFDQDLAEWLEHAAPVALGCAADRNLQNLWLRHGRTWFAGVNVLPNDAKGRVAGSGPLQGRAVDAARELEDQEHGHRPHLDYEVQEQMISHLDAAALLLRASKG